MPSYELFQREIELCSNVLTIDQKIEGDVHCVVWDAALVLAKYLEQQTINQKLSLNGLNVVELGSGLGCVGLAAACLGAKVILTDLKEVIPLLQTNIDNNWEIIKNANGDAVAKVINWGERVNFNVKPDLILLADCIYYTEAVEKLVNTLVDLCTADTKILLSQEDRDFEKQKINWRIFVQNVEKYFNLVEIPLVEQHPDYRSHDIKLFEMKLKKTSS